jgi:hypothetical protein
MVEAAETAVTFVTNRQRSDLESDRMLLFPELLPRLRALLNEE